MKRYKFEWQHLNEAEAKFTEAYEAKEPAMLTEFDLLALLTSNDESQRVCADCEKELGLLSYWTEDTDAWEFVPCVAFVEERHGNTSFKCYECAGETE